MQKFRLLRGPRDLTSHEIEITQQSCLSASSSVHVFYFISHAVDQLFPFPGMCVGIPAVDHSPAHVSIPSWPHIRAIWTEESLRYNSKSSALHGQNYIMESSYCHLKACEWWRAVRNSEKEEKIIKSWRHSKMGSTLQGDLFSMKLE